MADYSNDYKHPSDYYAYVGKIAKAYLNQQGHTGIKITTKEPDVEPKVICFRKYTSSGGIEYLYED